MSNYVHHVSGFFVRRQEAELAYDKLIGKGLLATQLRIFSKGDQVSTDTVREQSKVMLKQQVKEAILGGQVVLVVYTHSVEETALVGEAIQDAVGEYKDLEVV